MVRQRLGEGGQVCILGGAAVLVQVVGVFCTVQCHQQDTPDTHTNTQVQPPTCILPLLPIALDCAADSHKARFKHAHAGNLLLLLPQLFCQNNVIRFLQGTLLWKDSGLWVSQCKNCKIGKPSTNVVAVVASILN